MPDRPLEENTRIVESLLAEQKIPNSELARLISRYGGGDPLCAYLESNVPGKGEELLEIVGLCFRADGSLLRRHTNLAHLLYSGFAWTFGFGIQLNEPLIYESMGLSFKLTEACERLDVFLDRLFPWLGKLQSGCKDLPESWLPSCQCDAETVPRKEKCSRPDWALKAYPTLPNFDPWVPAESIEQDTWFGFPRDLGEDQQNFLFDAQRSVLGGLMRWLATFARYDADDRVIEVRHLIETIVSYGNFIWGVEWTQDGRQNSQPIIRPIVIVKSGSTQPVQRTSSSSIRVGCD